MKNWSYDNIPDQGGRRILVTGANSGLGFQIARALALKGAEVIMACRNYMNAEEAAGKIREEYQVAKLYPLKIDLTSIDSVINCALSIREEFKQLHVVINNAGVMIPPLSRTKQGFELQFGTNHLGHFVLVGQLFPLILQTPGARVVTVSSVAAKLNYIDFDDLNYDHKKYEKWQAYGQSKLANQMFMKELAWRLEKKGANAISVGAHPGVSSTNLFKNSSPFMQQKILPIISHAPDKAALSILRAACDPNVENGSYWGPSGLLGFTGSPGKAKLQAKALDPELTERLWKESEKLTGMVW